MKLTKVLRARSLAATFIECAKAVHEEAVNTSQTDSAWLSGSKRTGALRRASMELTRVLAEMRKP